MIMKRFLGSILGFLSITACVEPVIDTFGNVAGTVFDSQSGLPLGGVSVQLTPGGSSQVTTGDGTFQFDNLDIQEYTLTFKRSGYETYQQKVSVKPGLSTSVQVSMKMADLSLPTLAMNGIASLTSNSVRLTAMLSSLGNSSVTQYGFCYAEHELPTTSDQCFNLGSATSPGQFSQTVTGLKAETTYYCRAFAQNGAGLAYSDELTFTTPKADDGGQGGGGGEGGDGEGEIVVPQGLVAFYTFDNEDFNDRTDNELHGNGLNSPVFVAETPKGTGKALFLNSTKDQYMVIPYNPFKGLGHYSITFWIKDFNVGLIFSAISKDAVRSDFPRLLSTQQARFRFYTCYDNYDTTEPFSYSTDGIMASGWHHIAVVCDADGGAYSYNAKRYLYVDGKLVDSDAGSWTSVSDLGVCTSIHFGGNKNGHYSVASSMKLDNIRFYTISLSKDQVSSIYENEK